MTTPHPHADILRAIADGKTVQMRCTDAYEDDDVGWRVMTHFAFLDDSDYEWRVKPETIDINGHVVTPPLRVAPPV